MRSLQSHSGHLQRFLPSLRFGSDLPLCFDRPSVKSLPSCICSTSNHINWIHTDVLLYGCLQFLKWVHLPVILSAVKPWPPATPVNFNSWFLTGFIFQYVAFRHYSSWWKRYNYVLSAALDTGVAIAGPLLFLTLNHKKGELSWWGNPNKAVDHCPLALCPTAKGIDVTASLPSCPIF